MAIMVHGYEAHQILLAGASMKTSAPSDFYYESFSLELGDDARGVVAVVVPCFINKVSHKYFAFFFEVKKDENNGMIKFDLSSPFVPLPGRLGQIDEAGRITVEVDGKIFTNKFPVTLEATHPEYCHVDANSLCRYLAGLIDKEELKEASISSTDARTLEQRLATSEKCLESLGEELDVADKKIKELEKTLSDERREKALLVDKLYNFYDNNFAKKWFVNKKMRQHLRSLLPNIQKG